MYYVAKPQTLNLEPKTLNNNKGQTLTDSPFVYVLILLLSLSLAQLNLK